MKDAPIKHPHSELYWDYLAVLVLLGLRLEELFKVAFNTCGSVESDSTRRK